MKNETTNTTQTEGALVPIELACRGDNVDPTTIPRWIRVEGGGWFGRKYICSGCHKDGWYGWRCVEVR